MRNREWISHWQKLKLLSINNGRSFLQGWLSQTVKFNVMLRLTGEFCDVTIFCGTEVRFAHRCVIASGAFFLPWVEIQNILASDRLKNTVFSPIEVTKLTLDWSKWDLDVVDSLLLYIYTSRLNRSNLPGLHAASDFFAIEDLKKLIDSEINKPSNKHSKVADCLKDRITWSFRQYSKYRGLIVETMGYRL